MIRSTFKQLQVFLSIVEEGTFGRAADRLDISQPAVSRHIRALERETGALFIRRRGAKVALSSAGEVLQRRLPALLNGMEEVGLDLRRSAAENSVLRVGAGRYLSDCIRDNVTDFVLEHPDSSVDLIYIDSEEKGVEALRRGKIELLYMTRASDQFPTGCELIRPISAGLFGTPEVAADLESGFLPNFPIIMPNAGTQEEIFVRNFLRAHDIVFEIVARAQHVTIARDMALRGIGCCFLFSEIVEKECREGRLRALDGPMMTLFRCGYHNFATSLDGRVAAFDGFIRSRL